MGFSDLSPNNNITGGTDGTAIGNVSDSLKTHITNPYLKTEQVPSHYDVFGRMRVSLPVTIFDSDFWNDSRPELFAELEVNGGSASHDVNLSSMVLATTTTTGSRAVIQSRCAIRYRTGKSVRVIMTGNYKSTATNVKKYIGQFDDNNGPYFLLDGSTFKVGVRSKTSGSVVNTEIAQSSFNIDKLDGTGVSGITLDLTKQQIFIIEYQWLGSGVVKFGFSINGDVYYCHQFNNANTLAVPYSQTATLPLRAEVIASAGASATNMHVTCFTVQSEGGGVTATGHRETINTGTGLRTFVSTSPYPILAIRKQTGSLGVPIGLDSLYVFSSSADDLLWEVHVNPTLTGGSWVNNGNHMQYNSTATGMTAQGSAVYSFYVRGAAGAASTLAVQNQTEYPEFVIGSDLAGNSDVIVFAARSLTGSANVGCAVNYIALE